MSEYTQGIQSACEPFVMYMFVAVGEGIGVLCVCVHVCAYKVSSAYVFVCLYLVRVCVCVCHCLGMTNSLSRSKCYIVTKMPVAKFVSFVLKDIIKEEVPIIF